MGERTGQLGRRGRILLSAAGVMFLVAVAIAAAVGGKPEGQKGVGSAAPEFQYDPGSNVVTTDEPLGR